MVTAVVSKIAIANPNIVIPVMVSAAPLAIAVLMIAINVLITWPAIQQNICAAKQ